jgi:hypothetical protein
VGKPRQPQVLWPCEDEFINNAIKKDEQQIDADDECSACREVRQGEDD